MIWDYIVETSMEVEYLFNKQLSRSSGSGLTLQRNEVSSMEEDVYHDRWYYPRRSVLVMYVHDKSELVRGKTGPAGLRSVVLSTH